MHVEHTVAISIVPHLAHFLTLHLIAWFNEIVSEKLAWHIIHAQIISTILAKLVFKEVAARAWIHRAIFFWAWQACCLHVAYVCVQNRSLLLWVVHAVWLLEASQYRKKSWSIWIWCTWHASWCNHGMSSYVKPNRHIVSIYRHIMARIMTTCPPISMHHVSIFPPCCWSKQASKYGKNLFHRGPKEVSFLGLELTTVCVFRGP